jgi:hypothetical protein
MTLRQKVPQQGRSDCGVACLAMAASIEYSSALAIFDFLGLDAKRSHHPYSSNFSELLSALLLAGVNARKMPWRGWDSLRGSAILKVNPIGRSWHWVYASRHPTIGSYILDPSTSQYTVICTNLPRRGDGRPALDTVFLQLRDQFAPGRTFISILGK